jgi:hypothetical protein
VSDFRATRPDGTAPPAGTGIRFDEEGFGLIAPSGAGDLTVEASFTPSEAIATEGSALSPPPNN